MEARLFGAITNTPVLVGGDMVINVELSNAGEPLPDLPDVFLISAPEPSEGLAPLPMSLMGELTPVQAEVQRLNAQYGVKK